MKSKSELRIMAKDVRNSLDIERISHEVCEKIKTSDIYKSAKNVMVYYPMKYEISLLDLLNDNKNFYLPKVSNQELLVCPYDEHLEISNLGIYEPCSAPVNPDIIDLIFVPALMVDKEHNRLGYGGGFYDRFLAKYDNIKTVVPIAKELFVESLPQEMFDVKVDHVVVV